MKKIIVSLSVIGIVSVMAIGATVAYFGDTETSTGNTLTAGSIDLKIDFQCEDSHCDWTLRDVNGRVFFDECDIKPGDSEEVTLSWHVYDNNAWGRISLADVIDYENTCSNPESKAGDLTCGDPGEGDGELSDYLKFEIWLDEGATSDWQCPDGNNGPCPEDELEGDNVFNGVEVMLADVTADELLDGVELTEPTGALLELQGSTTYYLGLRWYLPSVTGNIVQTDSLLANIVMEVVQSRNNPNPWND